MPSAVAKSPTEVIAEIQMTRAAHPTCGILLVEGDRDRRFWEPRVRPQVQTIITTGRPNLLQSIAIANASPIVGVLGVADRDYDPDHSFSGLHNLAVTDHCDLEAELLASPALERVLSELGDSTLIAATVAYHGAPIFDVLQDQASVFGRVRCFLRSVNSPHPCARFAPHSYTHVDNHTWQIDRASIIADLAQLHGLSPNDVASAFLAHSPLAPHRLSHGKDMISLLCLGLGGLLGGKRASKEQVSALLRQSLDDVHFSQWTLRQRIESWEQSNGQYRILR